jgi:ketosteroid isomerase-like protein
MEDLMRTRNSGAAALLLVALAGVGSNEARGAAQPPSVRAVVDAEQSFCRTAAEKGTRAAFLSFLADSAVLFIDKPVAGRPAYESSPERPGVLTWKPRVAGISASGDFGYTTGPWEWRAGAGVPVEDFGTFVTAWRVQADGSWKAVMDIGINGPPPPAPMDSVPLPVDRPEPRTAGAPPAKDEATAIEQLLGYEAELVKTFAERGAVRAYATFLATDGVFLREGMLPLAGLAGAHTADAARPGTWTWQPLRAHAASSGDLGYVYGTCTFRGRGWPADSTERGSYARIWKRGMVVVDVVHPAPRRR